MPAGLLGGAAGGPTGSIAPDAVTHLDAGVGDRLPGRTPDQPPDLVLRVPTC